MHWPRRNQCTVRRSMSIWVQLIRYRLDEKVPNCPAEGEQMAQENWCHSLRNRSKLHLTGRMRRVRAHVILGVCVLSSSPSMNSLLLLRQRKYSSQLR